MTLNSLVVLSLALSGGLAAGAPPIDRTQKFDPKDPRYSDYRESSLYEANAKLETLAPPVREGKQAFVSANWGTGLRLGEINGLRATLAWVPSLLGLDVSVVSQSLRFGAFHVDPTFGDSTTDSSGGSYDSSDPNSELNRIRDELDQWSQFLIGPSLAVSGRLLPDWISPLWTERGRFGIMNATFKDKVNSLTFKGWVVTFDAWIQYQLWTGSPLALDLGMSHSWGAISRTGVTRQQGRLPVSWVQTHLGLSYWF